MERDRHTGIARPHRDLGIERPEYVDRVHVGPHPLVVAQPSFALLEHPDAPVERAGARECRAEQAGRRTLSVSAPRSELYSTTSSRIGTAVA